MTPGCKPIQDWTGQSDEKGEEQSGKVAYLFVARGVEGVADQRRGADAESAGEGEVARFEVADHVGFAQAEDDAFALASLLK